MTRTPTELMHGGFGPSGEPAVVTGTDVATVRDGRLATVHACS